MVRFLGILACAIALVLPPLSGGVRSAPGPSNLRAKPEGPLVFAITTPARPFISAHARTLDRRGQSRPFTADRKVVLTFDDGPDLATTPLVLDSLDRYGFKAAFFVAGRRLIGTSAEAQGRRALLKEIVARGHLVANHTVRHRNLCKEPQLIDQEIDQNQRILAQVLGQAPTLFRSPFGAHCPRLERAIADRHMVSVGWTVDPQDWRPRDPHEIANYVRTRLNSMDAHAVVLMHDTHTTGVRALPLILQWIVEEQARAVSGQVRPIVVLPPAALLPSRQVNATGLERVVQGWVEDLTVLPGISAVL